MVLGLVVGCGSGADIGDDFGAEVDVAGGKDDNTSSLVGNWELNGPWGVDPFSALTLTSAKKYSAETNSCSSCGSRDAQGAYKTTRSGSTRYIQFVGSSGKTWRYAYRFAGAGKKDLELRLVRTHDWLYFSHPAPPQPPGTCHADIDCLIPCEPGGPCPKSPTCNQSTHRCEQH